MTICLSGLIWLKFSRTRFHVLVSSGALSLTRFKRKPFYVIGLLKIFRVRQIFTIESPIV